MARPRLNPDDETTEIRVRLPTKDRDRAAAAAEKLGISVAELTRRALDTAVRTLERPISELIEASSLGTPAAKALRARTPPEVVEEIQRRVAAKACEHDWKNKGWGTVCSKCQEVKR